MSAANKKGFSRLYDVSRPEGAQQQGYTDTELLRQYLPPRRGAGHDTKQAKEIEGLFKGMIIVPLAGMEVTDWHGSDRLCD